MSNTHIDIDHPLKKISEIVESLDDTSKQLIAVMDEQIEAIIASNVEQVNDLTEAHSNLRAEFKKHERAFVKELVEILNPDKEKGYTVRLLNLKNLFPAAASNIEDWKTLLTLNTRRLQEKNTQVLQLLEFAMKRNGQMMRAIYGLHNEPNAHYQANGSKKGMMSGVAVNQEA